MLSLWWNLHLVVYTDLNLEHEAVAGDIHVTVDIGPAKISKRSVNYNSFSEDIMKWSVGDNERGRKQRTSLSKKDVVDVSRAGFFLIIKPVWYFGKPKLCSL